MDIKTADLEAEAAGRRVGIMQGKRPTGQNRAMEFRRLELRQAMHSRHALPRNATGKLPSQIAQDLLGTLQAQAATGTSA